MTKSDGSDGTGNKAAPAAATLLPYSKEEADARIERARRAAGYVPPDAYKSASIVQSARMRADAAWMKGYEHGHSYEESQRRMLLARRAAGYIGGVSSRKQSPLAPIATSFSAEMIEKARKAAGYSNDASAYKKHRLEPDIPAPPAKAPKLVSKYELEERIMRARAAAGYIPELAARQNPLAHAKAEVGDLETDSKKTEKKSREDSNVTDAKPGHKEEDT